ncbi:MAG: hypothetical protein ACRDL5_11180, partial [Solirubrobacteraceae bacterium]
MTCAPDAWLGRGRLTVRAWLAIVCAAGLVAGCGLGGGPSRAGPGPTDSGSGPALRAHVWVLADAPLTAVPSSFLGISTEYWSLPSWAASMPLLERTLALVHVRGDGPLILRIGGDSADHAFWDPNRAPMPTWAFGIYPRWLRQVRALVRRDHLRVILDLNLVTDTPQQAAQWAAAAEAALPRGTIIAFEIGNEPDIYSRTDWAAVIGTDSLEAVRLPGTPAADAQLPAAVSPQDYGRDLLAYAAALRRVAPHVGLAGPALADPLVHASWLPAVLATTPGALHLLTIHRYPYTGCRHLSRAANYATIARLLSPAATTGMASALRRDVAVAQRAGLPLRMTELNSVNCGGRPGVSDSFATALWAPDALFALARVGIDGVNVHVRADAINAAFAIGPRGLDARPLLYGLILFARALGPHPRLVRVITGQPRSLDLDGWVVRVGTRTLHVVLVDNSRRSARVTLQLPVHG